VPEAGAETASTGGRLCGSGALCLRRPGLRRPTLPVAALARPAVSAALAGAQAAEAAWFEREGALRREVAAQEERLRALEAQRAEAAAASAEGTRPLLRCGPRARVSSAAERVVLHMSA